MTNALTGDGHAHALDDVLISEELARRPSRPPDYEADCRRYSAPLVFTLWHRSGVG